MARYVLGLVVLFSGILVAAGAASRARVGCWFCIYWYITTTNHRGRDGPGRGLILLDGFA
jgi:hypothetical protein